MFENVIDNLIRYGNIIEGFFWIAIGACFAVAMMRQGRKRFKIIAAVNFAVFGCSDFVESHTGAWWKPTWLLLWKGLCITVMLLQFVFYLRAKSASSRPTDSSKL